MCPSDNELRHNLVQLLSLRSVKRGSFTLSSGKRSNYYIDARKTTMSAEGLEVIGQLGLGAVRAAGWSPDSVGGMTLGADPIAYAISLASRSEPPEIDAFTVRKTRKPHGTANRIEGCLPSGGRVVVIEDSITSGASTLAAIDVVREHDGTVLGVLSVVDREEGGREAVESAGYHLVSLVTLEDLGLP